MHEFLDFAGYCLLLAGSFFILTAAIGLFRLPDVLTRAHAAGVADVFGACLVLMGIAALSHSWAISGKLALLAAFLLATSPTACHALVQAALHDPEIKKKWTRTKPAEKAKDDT